MQTETTAAKPAAVRAGQFDPKPVLELIETIQADLDRLRGLVQPMLKGLDPADPRNKNCDGKLTPQGVECCYRMFDEGKSRYSVAQSMKISFAAATHRFRAWTSAGGEKRPRMRLG